jgi:hypothetical protein
MEESTSHIMYTKTTHTGIRDNPRDPDAVAFCRMKRCSGVLQRARQNPVSSRFLQIRRSRGLAGKTTWRGAHAPTASPLAISTTAKPRELHRAPPRISAGEGGGRPAVLRLASSAGEGGGRPAALRLASSAGSEGEAGEGEALFADPHELRLPLHLTPSRTVRPLDVEQRAAEEEISSATGSTSEEAGARTGTRRDGQRRERRRGGGRRARGRRVSLSAPPPSGHRPPNRGVRRHPDQAPDVAASRHATTAVVPLPAPPPELDRHGCRFESSRAGEEEAAANGEGKGSVRRRRAPA